MQKLLLVLTGLLVLSCSPEAPSPEKTNAGTDELIDIRVFPEGEIRLNGSMISESSLSSHIESLSTTKKTRARIIFDETVATGVIFKIQHLLHQEKITRVLSKMLTPEEFNKYNNQKVHIDILNTGKIFYDGNKIHPEDLTTSLTNTEATPDTEFILTVSNEAQVGPVFDIQHTLATNNFKRVSYESPSIY